jgi:hypothetical protein
MGVPYVVVHVLQDHDEQVREAGPDGQTYDGTEDDEQDQELAHRHCSSQANGVPAPAVALRSRSVYERHGPSLPLAADERRSPVTVPFLRCFRADEDPRRVFGPAPMQFPTGVAFATLRQSSWSRSTGTFGPAAGRGAATQSRSRGHTEERAR